ncbi:MAG: hypothetical protein L0Z55_09805, partial [Planctomycetes bacterium]|nr:hypothetical protein [Planctomycetota bacterium]
MAGRVEFGGREFLPGSPLATAAAAPPIRADGNSSGAAPPAGVPDSALPAGDVLDARDGMPLAGVRVRFAYSEMQDGYPPLPDEGSMGEVATDERGVYHLAPYRPHDLRLWAHLAFEHDDYQPAVLVTGERREPDGRWIFRRIELRRAATRRLEILDGAGRPLAGAALEFLAPFAPPYAIEGAAPVERTERVGAPTIRYAGPDGALLIAERAFELRLLDPLRYPALELDRRLPPYCDGANHVEVDSGAEDLTLFALEGPRERLLLQDQRGNLLENALVEIALEPAPAVRLYSGEDGSVEISPWPQCPPRRLGIEDPRHGYLRALSARVAGAELQVAIPSAERVLVLPLREFGRLEFRAVELTAAGEGEGIAVARIAVTPELAAIECTPGGNVILEGALPEAGTRMDVVVNGCLPRSVLVPFHPPGDLYADLGEVTFDRGARLRVRLAGIADFADEHCELQVTPAEEERAFTHVYPFAARSAVDIGALEIGKRYEFAVRRPSGLACGGEFRVTQSLLESGLAIDLTPEAGAADSILAGSIIALHPEELGAYDVIERYYLEGESEPLAFPPYPLAPDGIFGTRRWLRSPLRAEAFVLGPPNRAGSGAGTFDAESGLIAIAPVAIEAPRYAQFRFMVEGIGAVGLPAKLALFGERNRNHEVARLFAGPGQALIADNLLPGGYVLRWGGGAEEAESFAFFVTGRQSRIAEAIPRRPQDVEYVVIELVDAAGAPVEGATVRGASGAQVAEPEAGSYLVALATGRANLFDIDALGSPRASLEIEAGSGPAAPYLVRRESMVRARVVASDGLPFEGWIRVGWRAPDAGAAAAGDPVDLAYAPQSYRVHGGKLDDVVVPEGDGRIAMEAVGSQARTELAVRTAAGRETELGAIHLEETIAIGGRVRFSDGASAAGAK